MIFRNASPTIANSFQVAHLSKENFQESKKWFVLKVNLSTAREEIRSAEGKITTRAREHWCVTTRRKVGC
jgi:hypothetical protein